MILCLPMSKITLGVFHVGVGFEVFNSETSVS